MTLMSILLGSGPRVRISLTASGNNYDVYTNRGASYNAGYSDITVSIPAPTTIGSSSTGTYAMLVPNAFSPNDKITIINDGLIQGAGGVGGDGGPIPPAPGATTGGNGGVGGNAIYVNRPVTITNNGTIASGGGGGGGGRGFRNNPTPGKSGPIPGPAFAGGGGGGGAGTVGGGPGPSTRAVGGAGTSTAGGAGGPASPGPLSAGGAGGGRGAAGATTSGSGGAAGNYIVGNPFVTWPATGTRQGGVA